MRRGTVRNAYEDRRYDSYGEATGGYPTPSAYVPAARVRNERTAYRQEPSAGTDHRGRVTSVLSLLMSIVIVMLSFGGLILPSVMMRTTGGSDIVSTMTFIAMGATLILMALLLQAPTILLALRAVSTQKGHVGRGRGLVSVVVSCVFPIACLLLLLAFAAGRIQTAIDDGSLPQVTMGSDGRPQVTMPEGATGALGGVMGQVSELAEEGYSVGVDADGSLIATDPNGQTVTITEEDLARIGL